jgi:hypothetical protein
VELRRECPTCGAPLAKGDRRCGLCGADLAAKRPSPPPEPPPPEVIVEAEEVEAEEEEAFPAPARLLMAVAEVVPGLFRPLVLVLSPLAVLLAMGIAWFGMLLLSMGTLISAVMIGSVALIVYAHAAAWLLTARVEFLTESLIELDSRQRFVFFLLVFTPLTAIIAAMHYAAKAAG